MTMLDLVNASENDTTSQVETNLGAFNSRQRVSDFQNSVAKKPQPVGLQWGLVGNGDSGIEASSMNTLTRGNDSAQTACKRTTGQTLNYPL